MNIHSEADDLEISRLNEFFLVADMIRKAGRSARQGLEKFKKPNPSDGSARFPTLTSNEDPPFTNGSFALPVQGPREAPLAPSSPLSGSPLSKEGKNVIQALEDLAAFSDLTRCQLPDKNTQVISARNDGGSHEGHL